MGTLLLFPFTSPCSIGIFLLYLQPYTYPYVFTNMNNFHLSVLGNIHASAYFAYESSSTNSIRVFSFSQTQYCPRCQNNLVTYFTILIIHFSSLMHALEYCGSKTCIYFFLTSIFLS